MTPRTILLLAVSLWGCVRDQVRSTPAAATDSASCHLKCQAALQMLASAGLFLDGGRPLLAARNTDGGTLLLVATRELGDESGHFLQELEIELPCEPPAQGIRFARPREGVPGEPGFRLVLEAKENDAGERGIRVEVAEPNRCAVFIEPQCHGDAWGNEDYGEYRLKDGDLSCAGTSRP